MAAADLLRRRWCDVSDLFHWFGSDLDASETGDLRPVYTVEQGQQRIVRRLLTNPREGADLPADYIWHQDYGAGLLRRIGDLLDLPKLTSLIRSQIFLEDVVARTPEPEIIVREIPTGGVHITIRYTDAPTKRPVSLSFNINR